MPAARWPPAGGWRRSRGRCWRRRWTPTSVATRSASSRSAAPALNCCCPRRRRAAPPRPGLRTCPPEGGAPGPQGPSQRTRQSGVTGRGAHAGAVKGRSTGAFGVALRGWSEGWGIGVYQFVKSAKWRVGEETALRALGRLHDQTGEGGEVAWHKMGEGWSWIQRGDPDDHAANAREGWEQIKRDLAAERYGMYILDEFTYPMKWGWIDVAEVVAVLPPRPGHQHVVVTGPDERPDL